MVEKKGKRVAIVCFTMEATVPSKQKRRLFLPKFSMFLCTSSFSGDTNENGRQIQRERIKEGGEGRGGEMNRRRRSLKRNNRLNHMTMKNPKRVAPPSAVPRCSCCQRALSTGSQISVFK